MLKHDVPRSHGSLRARWGEGCGHPGDPCCQAPDGTRFCQDWQTENGRSFPQACVNDEVAVGDEAAFTCTPVS